MALCRKRTLYRVPLTCGPPCVSAPVLRLPVVLSMVWEARRPAQFTQDYPGRMISYLARPGWAGGVTQLVGPPFLSPRCLSFPARVLASARRAWVLSSWRAQAVARPVTGMPEWAYSGDRVWRPRRSCLAGT